MFGLGQKRQEKKAKKELEKLEKKEAKVKEKLAKLEEKQKKKDKKKGVSGKKPDEPRKRYEFMVAGTDQYMGYIRYELTEYNPEFDEPEDDEFGLEDLGVDDHEYDLFKPEEGDKVYKYVQKKAEGGFIQEDDGRVRVLVNGKTVGFVPDDQVDDFLRIVTEYPNCTAKCYIEGGEYKEYTKRGTKPGNEPYTVKVVLLY